MRTALGRSVSRTTVIVEVFEAERSWGKNPHDSIEGNLWCIVRNGFVFVAAPEENKKEVSCQDKMNEELPK